MSVEAKQRYLYKNILLRNRSPPESEAQRLPSALDHRPGRNLILFVALPSSKPSPTHYPEKATAKKGGAFVLARFMHFCRLAALLLAVACDTAHPLLVAPPGALPSSRDVLRELRNLPGVRSLPSSQRARQAEATALQPTAAHATKAASMAERASATLLHGLHHISALCSTHSARHAEEGGGELRKAVAGGSVAGSATAQLSKRPSEARRMAAIAERTGATVLQGLNGFSAATLGSKPSGPGGASVVADTVAAEASPLLFSAPNRSAPSAPLPAPVFGSEWSSYLRSTLAVMVAAWLGLCLFIQVWLIPHLLQATVECQYAFVRLSYSRGVSLGLARVRVVPPSVLASINENALGMFFPTRLAEMRFDEVALDVSPRALLRLLSSSRADAHSATAISLGGTRSAAAASTPRAAANGAAAAAAADHDAPPPAPREGARVLTLRLDGCVLRHDACPSAEWHGGEGPMREYLLYLKDHAIGRVCECVGAHARALGEPTGGGHAAVPVPDLGSRKYIRQALPHLRLLVSPCELKYADAAADALLVVRFDAVKLSFDDPPNPTLAGVAPQRVRVEMVGFRLHAEALPPAASPLLAAAEALEAEPRLGPVLRVGGKGEDVAASGPAADAIGSSARRGVSEPGRLEVVVATEYRPDLVNYRKVGMRSVGAPLVLSLLPEQKAALERLSALSALFGEWYSKASDSVNLGAAAVAAAADGAGAAAGPLGACALRPLVTAAEMDALIANASAVAQGAAAPPTAPSSAGSGAAGVAGGSPAKEAAEERAAADLRRYPTHVVCYARMLGQRRAKALPCTATAGATTSGPTGAGTSPLRRRPSALAAAAAYAAARTAALAAERAAEKEALRLGVASLVARLRHPSLTSGSGVGAPAASLAPETDSEWEAALEALEAGECYAAGGSVGSSFAASFSAGPWPAPIPAGVLEARARQLFAVGEHLLYDGAPLHLAPELKRWGFVPEPCRLRLSLDLGHVILKLQVPAAGYASSGAKASSSGAAPAREVARLT